MNFLSIQDVENMLRVARKKSLRDHLMLLLCFRHGLRASEVAALEIEHVKDGQIYVERLKGSLKTDQPLLSSDNELFDEVKALQNWLAVRPQSTPYLFPSRKKGGKMTGDSVSQIAKLYMLEVGVREKLAHIHSLKHAVASLMVRNGCGVEQVSRWVGHKDCKNTVNFYLHISDDEAGVAAGEALSKALSC